MTAFTVTESDTALLHDVVASASGVGQDPVPWPMLDSLRSLLRCDEICFAEIDTTRECHPVRQVIDPDGVRSLLREDRHPEDEADFWLGYWSSFCSYADRTGDYASVTKMSDFLSRRQARDALGGDTGLEHEMMACLPLDAPGRHLRLLAWRVGGQDFSERDRLLLVLLRPHLAAAYWSGQRARSGKTLLTGRQLELMTLVRDGHTNLQVANRLGLSEGTVRTHLANIYERLGVGSRTAAVTKVFGLPTG